MGSELMGMKLW